MFFYYGLNETLFDPPQSVHVWRQTNSLSLTHNYYQYKQPFFEPEMHNQFGNDGTSGKAVGEFPVIYYFVAQLWRIFGKHEWIFQLLHVIIIFSGLFSIFYSLKYLLKSSFWAGFNSLITFTSPMVVFYGPKFLPDVPALMFVFIAWYYILRFIKKRQVVNLWASALFFCLSMLLKVTSGFSFIALGGWLIFELIFQHKSDRIFNFRLKHFLPFILVLIPVFAWYFYADYYNTVNQGHFSTHGIWPLWTTTKENIYRIIDVQNKIFFKQLFLPFLQYTTLVIWFFLIITIKKLQPIFQYFIIVLPIGFLVQVILWFQILDYHDYYLINQIVVLVAFWAIFIIRVKSLLSSLNFRIVLKVFFIAFFIWNVIACREQVQTRYEGWMNETYHKHFKALLVIEPSFQKWGIEPEDKVISIPDFTINTTLYYMNRKGYTDFASDFSTPETFYRRIEQGAKYLIVNDSTLLKSEIIQPFIKDKIGEFKNVSVYNLQKLKTKTND
jgi:hypothetical protein